MTGSTVRFEDFILDPATRELRRGGALVAMEPQVFDLLAYVVANRERVVTKDDLIEAVWGGRVVSDSTLTTRINAMRKALGDSGEEQRLVRTVARKGIRFVGAVKAEAEAQVRSATAAFPALTLPEKASIAVLPFQNMSGDAEQDYFCDGLVEEVITALSRFHWLFVIARNSSFTYKGRSVDVKQVSRELGVRYVLEGSVRKSGTKVRITGQLIDGTSGAHIWADRFDGTLEDIFDLQDQVTMSVVGAIEPKLRQAEIERVRRKPTESLDAYDHLLRAYAHSHTFTREGSDQALESLRRALERDPMFTSATGFASWCYRVRRVQAWARDSVAEAAEACRLARVVAGGDRTDALAMAYAAFSLASFERDHETAKDLVDAALALNPNSFQVLAIDGWIRLYSHDLQRALVTLQKAYRLNAADPLIFSVMAGLSDAYRSLGQTEEALRWARLAVPKRPDSVAVLQTYVLALVAADRVDEARAIAKDLLRLNPTLTVSSTRRVSAYLDDPLREWRMTAYQKAGLPE